VAAVKRAQTGEPPGPTGDLEALSTRLLTAAGWSAARLSRADFLAAARAGLGPALDGTFYRQTIGSSLDENHLALNAIDQRQ
jgi:hypothetical protein